MLYQDQTAARNSLLSTLGNLADFIQQSPNTMIASFFLQNRSDELIGIFKKADPLTKAKAVELLSKIDVSNISNRAKNLCTVPQNSALCLFEGFPACDEVIA